VEECLVGEELSAFAIADGEMYKMLPFARDYKQIGDGDLGPNTGGMGSYSPVALPDDAFAQTIEKTVFEPILRALAESGNPYQGFLYAGLMLTAEGVKVIEFNARLGDPETQAILPLLGGDFADTAYLAARGRLAEANLEIISGSSCCVVMASEGYPADYETGFPIEGLGDVGDDLLVFQAGTSVRNEELVTSGGRVLAVVGLGDDLENARIRAYGALETVSFEGAYYRADIGAAEQNGVGGGNA
jgi:phosphoribosylamine--glycine ligase